MVQSAGTECVIINNDYYNDTCNSNHYLIYFPDLYLNFVPR